MAEDATLKDVTASPNPPVAADAKEPEKQAPAVAAPSPEDADALEVGRLLIGSGYSKEQVNDILQAPQALASLRHLINENPRELISLLDRTNPDVAKKLLDAASDEFVKRYGKDEPATGSTKKDAPPELMAEVESMRSELNQFRTEREQAAARATMASVKARYDARVDDLFNQLPKDSGLTKAEVKALRARIDTELASDPTVVQRVSNGNFVDVPLKFKAVIDEWVGDRKSAADAEKRRRDGVVDGALPEFMGGPNPFFPSDKSFADSWDATEDALAKALTQASR